MSNHTISKQVLLRAPLKKVWSAISEAKQFGAWFGLEADREFQPNTEINGKIRPTKVDPEVAKMQEPYNGFAFKIWIDRIEPMKLFSFQWHPYAVDTSKDYANEPKTTVTFTLEEKTDGVLLTITESGYENVPAARREEAYKANDGGWTHQCQLIAKYLKT